MPHRILTIAFATALVLIGYSNASAPYVSFTKPLPSSPAKGTLQGQGVFDGDPAAHVYDELRIHFIEASFGKLKTSREWTSRKLSPVPEDGEILPQKLVGGKYTQGAFVFKHAKLSPTTKYEVRAALKLNTKGGGVEVMKTSQVGIYATTK